jgi:hypothetical protein
LVNNALQMGYGVKMLTLSNWSGHPKIDHEEIPTPTTLFLFKQLLVFTLLHLAEAPPLPVPSFPTSFLTT